MCIKNAKRTPTAFAMTSKLSMFLLPQIHGAAFKFKNNKNNTKYTDKLMYGETLCYKQTQPTL